MHKEWTPISSSSSVRLPSFLSQLSRDLYLDAAAIPVCRLLIAAPPRLSVSLLAVEEQEQGAPLDMCINRGEAKEQFQAYNNDQTCAQRPQHSPELV